MAFDGLATDFAPAKVDPLTITDPRERLKYLAEFLRGLDPHRFRIQSWFTAADGGSITPSNTGQVPAEITSECGTAACIGGWTLSLFAPKARIKRNGPFIEQIAGRLLGLDPDTANELFMPAGFLSGGFTAPQAAAAIDSYLATGEVDWSKARA